MEINIKNDLTVNEYNNLRNTVGWDSKDMNIAENAIKRSVIVKKVIIDNKTIGMARVIGDGIYYLIVDAIIDPEYQKKGIGKMLINDIIKEIENMTEQGQKCSIILESANGKEEFYEKCGFRKIPFDYHGYGMIQRIEK